MYIRKMNTNKRIGHGEKFIWNVCQCENNNVQNKIKSMSGNILSIKKFIEMKIKNKNRIII